MPTFSSTRQIGPHRSTSPPHVARRSAERRGSYRNSLVVTRLAFVRIVSNPAILRRPVTPGKAWQQVEEWLACEPAWVPLPGARHAELLRQLLNSSFMTSRLDAHLAALAIEHGLTLHSTDGDFARFPGLKCEN